MKRGVVLFSGGLDSTACLYWAKRHYDEVIMLTINYGSREESVMNKVAEFFSKELKIPLKIIRVNFLNEFSKLSGSALVEGNVPRVSASELEVIERAKETARSVWVPARNLVLISIAASLLDALGGGDIIVGFNKEEGETFPDNTKEFVERVNKALEYATMNKVRVVAPLIELDKRGIARLLKELGAKYEYSNSCYDPKGFTEDGKPIHCGRCESCVRRHRGLMEGIGEDKTVYLVTPKL
ncbi:7-cyano-7-deazaguanine synthase QueC [Pyrococcus horikoshii]|uniref:7-cyano-7-deazaguanine synthase n=2 Tax=Pyrococcus horikoshii TaxID=53953 RepID=QUEC_PYRHO|nr:7-cyano-7-deazaguanine synthase QueC [Pyrococcus horikoshii]O57836.2 RecName: Full=7-cyano-7-deazaguanine synthase; AltName: Full=7-cyano-7-carbaguanine synthase; AltName: Full=Archaeosine biosynthesis protein QueC; AltName: Full=PreQ(0) synthase [Pyrococcus horikoshii OT3]HII61555.1 7-cyano-7-deazaguanine synthase QueC [Pyrococcus horikoshii]